MAFDCDTVGARAGALNHRLAGFDVEVWGDGVGVYRGGEGISAPLAALGLICLGYVQE